MCRFLTYAGAPLLLADLLYRPVNSLIMQTHHARERIEPFNGDGFGVGWYVPAIDPTPCVQRSVTPAWSNHNLQALAAKTRAESLFAHVRAASPGMAVTEANVHPFSYDRFMWMHNGAVASFRQIERRLRDGLKDEFYNMIEGTTDSEHAFALFLNSLRAPFGEVSGEEMRRALVETIERLNALYYSRGLRFECLPDGLCDMHTVTGGDEARAVIVASERLTDDDADWTQVPDNHTIMVLPDLSVKIERI